jgi:hypothetical protein
LDPLLSVLFGGIFKYKQLATAARQLYRASRVERFVLDDILCDRQVQVEAGDSPNSVRLTLRGEATVSYSLSRDCVRAVLEGETVQIAGHGGFCKLTMDGEFIWATYAVGGRSSSCVLSRRKLEQAVAA